MARELTYPVVMMCGTVLKAGGRDYNGKKYFSADIECRGATVAVDLEDEAQAVQLSKFLGKGAVEVTGKLMQRQGYMRIQFVGVKE